MSTSTYEQKSWAHDVASWERWKAMLRLVTAEDSRAVIMGRLRALTKRWPQHLSMDEIYQ